MSEISRVEEEANLILTASVIDNRTSGEAVKGVGTILGELKADGKIEDYDTPENADITNIKFDVSSITLGAGDNEELTATFDSGSDVGGYYVQIKGKKYLVSKVNDKIEIGKTEITTNGNSKREIKSVGTSNSSVVNVEKVGNDGIRITGVAVGGPVTIKVEYTDEIYAVISVTVKRKITVTAKVYSEDESKGNVSIVPGSADNKYVEGSGVSFIATANSGYQFEGWYDGTGTNLLSDSNPYIMTVGTKNITRVAKFQEKKLYGEKVQLNEGNPIKVKTVGTTNYTIEDNWSLFYIDDDEEGYVHLIYGDYYPTDVQTEIATDNAIFAPAHTDDNGTISSRAWSVNSRKNRVTLLRYLKNNSSYNETDLDSSVPSGSYESWVNLSKALTAEGKILHRIEILVQGAPNITMWVNSWNEQGYGELLLQSINTYEKKGYDIGIKTDSDNQNFTYTISTPSEGRRDRLYFPNRGNEDSADEPNAGKAAHYWIASPGANKAGTMLYAATHDGRLGYSTNTPFNRSVIMI